MFHFSYVRRSVGFAHMWLREPGTHRPLPPWRRGAPRSVAEPPVTWSLCQPSPPGSAPVGRGRGGGGGGQRLRVNVGMTILGYNKYASYKELSNLGEKRCN